MPSVPRRQLSPGEINENVRTAVRFANKRTPGTKNFPTYKLVEAREKSRNGDIKITKPAVNEL